MGKVKILKNGFSIRDDQNLGLLIFSKHTGMVFACHKPESAIVSKWVQGQCPDFSDPKYIKAIGPGWVISLKDAVYPTDHLLPTPAFFKIPIPSAPIVINWLITGKCSNRCTYCYAEDLMHDKCIEPTKSEVKSIANNILEYNPLVVVLTGGDPLSSEHLYYAIELLQKRTAIVLDTSGLGIDTELAKILLNAGVFVRISLDSEIPRINDDLRPSLNRNNLASDVALRALQILLKTGVAVGVQSVATKKNRSDFEAFGNKLYRLGIRSWRILTLAKSSTNAHKMESLLGPQKGQARFNDYIQKEIYSRHERGWNKGMGVQITRNDVPNSVVLVAPDGRFLTESRITPGKVEFDPKNPKKPDLNKMLKLLDLHAHSARYLS